METWVEITCMAEMGKTWGELRYLAQEYLNSGCLSVPMLHRVLGERSDSHDVSHHQTLKG